MTPGTSGTDRQAAGARIVLLVAGIGAMVGPLLPWLTVATASGQVQQNGFAYAPEQAWGALVVGVLASAVAIRLLAVRRYLSFTGMLGMLVLALVLGGLAISGSDQVGRQSSGGVGLGLYALFGATGALYLGSLWHGYLIGRGKPSFIIGANSVGLACAAMLILALVPMGGSDMSPAQVPAIPAGAPATASSASAHTP